MYDLESEETSRILFESVELLSKEEPFGGSMV
jgi:hypothetical protein